MPTAFLIFLDIAISIALKKNGVLTAVHFRTAFYTVLY